MGERALLTDTHPLVFNSTATRRLSRRAAAHFKACELLICAAARSLDLPLLTRDAVIEESGLDKVVW